MSLWTVVVFNFKIFLLLVALVIRYGELHELIKQGLMLLVVVFTVVVRVNDQLLLHLSDSP